MIGKKYKWITKVVLMVCLLFVSGFVFLIQADEGNTRTQKPVPTDILDRSVLQRPSKSNPKLGSSLNQLLGAYQRNGTMEAQAFAIRHQMVVRDDQVQVTIITADNKIDQVRDAVEAAGGDYELHYRNRLQAMVPVGVLKVLSNRSDIHVVREPRRAFLDDPMQFASRAGDQTTEGVSASNANAWHTAGYDGTGTRVAVIDGGFSGYSGLLGTDLPDTVTTYDWTGTGMEGSAHGTACAEVVFDMAPGIMMDLHKVSTTEEIANAVSQAITDGIDIVSMSLGWHLDGPGDGTGPLADLVNNARTSGIFFTKSAGNNAEASWSGTFTDTTGDDFHEWVPGAQNINYFGPGDGNGYVIPAGAPIAVFLHWNDWTDVDQDYDLLLVYWNGSSWQLAAWSDNSQNGGAGQTPEESIGITAPLEGVYGVIVVRYSATRDVCFRMHTWPQYGLDERVPERSLSFPADSPDAITVGAVDV
ncbi:MAG: S8 family serine peptidase, partial [Desulfobacteraceae bacterium]